MKIQKLEDIRGFAAIYVVVHHFIGYTILRNSLPPFVRLPFRFGQEAVILFFLLSGFVIYISVRGKNNLSFGDYFLKRTVRIYPILLIAFGVSILIALSSHYHFSVSDVWQLIGNFFMLQDTDNKPGSFCLPFLQNFPLWSLSYEWAFYMMFFPLYHIRSKKIVSQKFIYYILAISSISWIAYLVFPNHLLLILSYFVIWWAGLECADIYLKDRNFSFSNILHVLVSLLVMVCVTSIPIIKQYIEGRRNFSQIEYPILTFRHYLFTFITVIVGLVWWKFKLIYFNRIFSYFGKLSLISYAVYTLHFPFIWLTIPFIHNPYLVIIIKLIIVFSLCMLIELKIQPGINHIIFNKHKRRMPKTSVLPNT